MPSDFAFDPSTVKFGPPDHECESANSHEKAQRLFDISPSLPPGWQRLYGEAMKRLQHLDAPHRTDLFVHGPIAPGPASPSPGHPLDAPHHPSTRRAARQKPLQAIRSGRPQRVQGIAQLLLQLNLQRERPSIHTVTPPANDEKIAALYLRSSKDRSDISIDTQRRALHEMAVARGLTVVNEFADAVQSGKDEDRPAWLRVISELNAPGRGWGHVLVLDTSRVARRRLIAMMFEANCAKRGVSIAHKSLPESDDATDMMLRSMLQAFDEYHSLISRAKGLAGMAENVRQG